LRIGHEHPRFQDKQRIFIRLDGANELAKSIEPASVTPYGLTSRPLVDIPIVKTPV